MGELGMDPSKEERSPDLPDDHRTEWAEEDREIEDRKPDLGEIEEDASEL
jgi:hypothetical protein